MTDEAEPQKDGAAVGFGCSGNLVGFGLIFVLASHSFRIQREAFRGRSVLYELFGGLWVRGLYCPRWWKQ